MPRTLIAELEAAQHKKAGADCMSRALTRWAVSQPRRGAR